jgi:hypothetical protein
MHALLDEIMLPGLFPRSLIDVAADLRTCVVDLSRKPRATQAPRASRPMTRIIKQQVIDLHRLHPELTQHQIATALGVNPGRVSETIAGYRT